MTSSPAMRSGIVLVLVILLILSVTSCGGGGTSTTSGTARGSGTTPGAPPTTPPTTPPGSTTPPPPTALSITTAAMPNAVVSQGYGASVQAAGGTKPYKFSVISGSLPAGLSLNASNGIISGTPPNLGLNLFTVQVTDSASSSATVSKQLSISVVATGAAQPALPQVFVDTTMPDTTGYMTKTVCSSLTVCDFTSVQAAVNSAVCGEIIELAAGQTFGKISLTNHNCSANSWIVIQSSKTNLLPAGTRVNPSHVANLARVETSVVNSAAVDASGILGTGFYRLIGLEIALSPSLASQISFNGGGSSFDNALVSLGGGAKQLSEEPHDIIIDRCWIHGQVDSELRRGVFLDGINQAVISSYIEEVHQSGSDTQAILTTSGAGPYKIVNNFLSAGAENFMSGGGAPSVPGELPSDVEIRHNFFFKPLSWKASDPTFFGHQWIIKNLLELKFARRFWIDSNIFSHSWTQAQTGNGWVFTPRCQLTTAGVCHVPQAVIDDITVSNNVMYDAEIGMQLSGRDTDPLQLIRVHRLSLHDNVMSNVTKFAYQILNGPVDVTLNHNSMFNEPGTLMIVQDSGVHAQNFTMVDELDNRGLFGVFCNGGSEGTSCLATLLPGAVFHNNVLKGANGNFYPPSNQQCGNQTCFPTASAVGHANLAACTAAPESAFDISGCALASSSPYKNQASDGKDPGADFGTLLPAVACVRSGVNCE